MVLTACLYLTSRNYNFTSSDRGLTIKTCDFINNTWFLVNKIWLHIVVILQIAGIRVIPGITQWPKSRCPRSFAWFQSQVWCLHVFPAEEEQYQQELVV